MYNTGLMLVEFIILGIIVLLGISLLENLWMVCSLLVPNEEVRVTLWDGMSWHVEDWVFSMGVDTMVSWVVVLISFVVWVEVRMGLMHVVVHCIVVVVAIIIVFLGVVFPWVMLPTINVPSIMVLAVMVLWIVCLRVVLRLVVFLLKVRVMLIVVCHVVLLWVVVVISFFTIAFNWLLEVSIKLIEAVLLRVYEWVLFWSLLCAYWFLRLWLLCLWLRCLWLLGLRLFTLWSKLEGWLLLSILGSWLLSLRWPLSLRFLGLWFLLWGLLLWSFLWCRFGCFLLLLWLGFLGLCELLIFCLLGWL